MANIDTINGTADIETWFQKIKGLRLIEHYALTAEPRIFLNGKPFADG